MDQDDNGPEYGTSGQPGEDSSHRAPPQAPNGPYRAIYPDLITARAAKAARIENAILEAHDSGVFSNAPTDPAHQRIYIKRLYDAFLSVETEGDNAIIDKPCKNGKMSQAALKFQNGRYPSHAIEEVCWEVFDKASTSQLDVRLLEPYHDSKFEGITIHSSFNYRWASIVNACARSKALCKMLLDPPYLERFVSHPQAELKMKLNNKKINAQRDAQNEIGRTFLSKGLGKEEAAEAIAALHPDEEDSFDEFAFTGPRQQSAGNAAGPTTPLAPVRVQPPRAATNSTKRKKISESDDDDDEEDEYVDSAVRSNIKPSLRSRRATLKTPTRSNTSNSVMEKTPQSKKAKLPSTAARQRRMDEIASQKSQAEIDLEADEKYRTTICRLLGISAKHPQVKAYSLEDLRYYARAYNGEYAGTIWTHKDYPGYSGDRWILTDRNNVAYTHFSQLIKALMPLAALRGDYVDGQLNLETKNIIFQPKNPADREALGSTANNFGFHAAYPAPVNIKSHGSPEMLTEEASFSAPAPAPTRQPAVQMASYQPYRQELYQGQGTYDQSGLQYPSYNQNHGNQSFGNLPHSYGSASRAYSHNSFQQATLGNQQAFGTPHSTYGSPVIGYNSQPGNIYDNGLTFTGRNNNVYAASLRGQNTGYTAGHAAQSTAHNTPQVGHNTNLTSPYPGHITGLTIPRHGDSQYPDPDECSSQQRQQ
ncbi:hypothetical protein SBOR_7025 [Sclerotinia borealis F-4128]|uniref:Uncharacterized protein n=1 Tax=Sclerotinia borealis (strain F-4128) TaxID=1432307 RepID=W9C9X7_SCLBF|nr:hypothetical protein SBOR_7025 [Sclerotinia borealis F-4128]